MQTEKPACAMRPFGLCGLVSERRRCNMANCLSCGAALPERALFCPNCGVKQEQADPVDPAEPAVEASFAQGFGEPQEEPAAERAAEPASEPAVEPVVLEGSEVASEPEIAAAVEPAVVPEPAPAPASESASAPAPASEPESAPVAEPVAEPVVELVAEPVVEPASEPSRDAWAPSPAGTYPTPEGFSGDAGASAASSASSAPQGAWSTPQPDPQAGAPFAAQPAASQQPIYAQGCVAAAVNDVKGDPLLLRNSLLLGLISFVPILNFVVEGYAVNWAREIPFGGRTQMPRKIVTGRNFEIGFYLFLIALVVGLVAGIASSVLAVIPILGWLAGLAVSLGASMFQGLMQLRVGLSQQLGEGFKVSAVWNVLKRNWTGLLCATLIPSLVAAGILCVAVLIGTLLMTVAVVPVGFAAGGSVIGAGLGAVACIVAALVCVVLAVACAACLAVAALVTMRAVAHWVARYAPEWADAAWWSTAQNQQY